MVLGQNDIQPVLNCTFEFQLRHFERSWLGCGRLAEADFRWSLRGRLRRCSRCGFCGRLRLRPGEPCKGQNHQPKRENTSGRNASSRRPLHGSSLAFSQRTALAGVLENLC